MPAISELYGDLGTEQAPLSYALNDQLMQDVGPGPKKRLPVALPPAPVPVSPLPPAPPIAPPDATATTKPVVPRPLQAAAQQQFIARQTAKAARLRGDEQTAQYFDAQADQAQAQIAAATTPAPAVPGTAGSAAGIAAAEQAPSYGTAGPVTPVSTVAPVTPATAAHLTNTQPLKYGPPALDQMAAKPALVSPFRAALEKEQGISPAQLMLEEAESGLMSNLSGKFDDPERLTERAIAKGYDPGKVIAKSRRLPVGLGVPGGGQIETPEIRNADLQGAANAAGQAMGGNVLFGGSVTGIKSAVSEVRVAKMEYEAAKKMLEQVGTGVGRSAALRRVAEARDALLRVIDNAVGEGAVMGGGVNAGVGAYYDALVGPEDNDASFSGAMKRMGARAAIGAGLGGGLHGLNSIAEMAKPVTLHDLIARRRLEQSESSLGSPEIAAPDAEAPKSKFSGFVTTPLAKPGSSVAAPGAAARPTREVMNDMAPPGADVLLGEPDESAHERGGARAGERIPVLRETAKAYGGDEHLLPVGDLPATARRTPDVKGEKYLNVELHTNNDPRVARLNELPPEDRDELRHAMATAIVPEILKSEGVKGEVKPGVGQWFNEGVKGTQDAVVIHFDKATTTKQMQRVAARVSKAMRQSAYFMAEPVEHGKHTNWAMRLELPGTDEAGYRTVMDKVSEDARTFNGSTMLKDGGAAQIVFNKGAAPKAIAAEVHRIAGLLDHMGVKHEEELYPARVRGADASRYDQIVRQRGGLTAEQSKADSRVDHLWHGFAHEVGNRLNEHEEAALLKRRAESGEAIPRVRDENPAAMEYTRADGSKVHFASSNHQGANFVAQKHGLTLEERQTGVRGFMLDNGQFVDAHRALAYLRHGDATERRLATHLGEKDDMHVRSEDLRAARTGNAGAATTLPRAFFREKTEGYSHTPMSAEERTEVDRHLGPLDPDYREHYDPEHVHALEMAKIKRDRARAREQEWEWDQKNPTWRGSFINALREQHGLVDRRNNHPSYGAVGVVEGKTAREWDAYAKDLERMTPQEFRHDMARPGNTRTMQGFRHYLDREIRLERSRLVDQDVPTKKLRQLEQQRAELELDMEESDRFRTRMEAWQAEDRLGGGSGVLHDNTSEYDGPERRAIEKVVRAGIRVNGKVYTGFSHAGARDAAIQDRALAKNHSPHLKIDEGYTTSRGRFLDPKRAHDLAVAAGQMSAEDAAKPGHLSVGDVPLTEKSLYELTPGERRQRPRGEEPPNLTQPIRGLHDNVAPVDTPQSPEARASDVKTVARFLVDKHGVATDIAKPTAEALADAADAASKIVHPGDLLPPGTREVGWSPKVLADLLNRGVTEGMVGKKVESAADLATHAQILRDPRFETFRVHYVKDGKIVMHEAHSSRLPAVNVAFAFDNGPAAHIAHVVAMIDKLGADGIYLMHNHPSGRAAPSIPDMIMTDKLARTYGDKFLGHVIINHGTYSVLTAENAAEYVRGYRGAGGHGQMYHDRVMGNFVHDLPPGWEEHGGDLHKGKGAFVRSSTIHGITDLVKLAKQIELDPTKITVVHADARNVVRAVIDVPTADVSAPDFADQMIEHGRATGAVHMYAIVPDGALENQRASDSPWYTITKLMRDHGIFSDAVEVQPYTAPGLKGRGDLADNIVGLTAAQTGATSKVWEGNPVESAFGRPIRNIPGAVPKGPPDVWRDNTTPYEPFTLNDLRKKARDGSIKPEEWPEHAARFAGRMLTADEEARIAGAAARGDRAGLIAAVMKTKRSGMLDKGLSAWVSGLLTTGTPYIAKAAGDVSIATLETMKDPLAAVFDMIASGVRGAVSGRPSAEFRTKAPTISGLGREQVRGFTGPGYEAAKQIMRTGVSPKEAENWDFRARANFDTPILQAYVNGPMKVLSAETAMFHAAAVGRSLHEYLTLAARKEARAAGVPTKGKQYDAIFARLESAPPADLQLRAIADADYATFYSKNVPAQIINAARQKAEETGSIMGKVGTTVLMPFVKTPTNIFLRFVDYSPVGIVKEVLTQATHMQPDQRRLVEALARSTVGTAFIALGAIMQQHEKARGDRARDARIARRDEITGDQPDALKVGGYSSRVARITPPGMLFALGASLAAEWDQQSKDTSTSRATKVGKTAAKGATLMAKETANLPFLSGVAGAAAALEDPTRQAERFAERTVGSVVPAGVRAAAKALDPKVREAHGVAESVESGVPGLSRRLPARVNAFGEDVEKRSVAPAAEMWDITHTNRLRRSPALDELTRLGVGLPGAGQIADSTAKGGTRARKPAEARTFLREQGPQLKDALDALVSHEDYQRLPDPYREKLLSSIESRVHKEALAREGGATDRTDVAALIDAAIGDLAIKVQARDERDVREALRALRKATQGVDVNKMIRRRAAMGSLPER